MRKFIALSSCAWISIFFFGGIAISVERGPAGKAGNASEKSIRSAKLMWDAPTRNTNGSPLEDLAGYKIYYGLRPQKYEKVIKVPRKIENRNDGSEARTECRYILPNLGKETHYFAVKAYNKSGEESDFSNEVNK